MKTRASLKYFVSYCRRKAAQTLSICHWNLNNICAHNFAKLSLLRDYVSVHKFGIICSSEKYLDSSIDDESLEISGCYLIRSDDPSNKKWYLHLL